MNKKILSVLVSCSLLFGTVFANAVSIEIEKAEENNAEINILSSRATDEVIKTINLPHTHNGDSSKGTGCYTTPVYHQHIGSPNVAGGCYADKGGYIWVAGCGWSHSAATGHASDYSPCPSCGGPVHFDGTWGSYMVWTCGHSEYKASIQLNCGKTTSTIENYQCNASSAGTIKITKSVDGNYTLTPYSENVSSTTSIVSFVWNNGNNGSCVVKGNGNYICTVTYIDAGVTKTHNITLNITDAYANYIVRHYQMNLDGVNYTLKDSETKSALIGNSVNPETKTYTGFTAPEMQTATISASGTVISYYYTRNKYTVTYIDKTSDGKELGRTTKQVFYDTNVNGSDIGNSVSDNAYYNQYKYQNETSSKVTTEGTIIYRIFEFCYTKKEAHINWNDNDNIDKLRPEEYTVLLKQNGDVVDTITIPSFQNNYIFENIPQYDENGIEYDYDLVFNISDRYNIETDSDGNYIVSYEKSSFNVMIPKKIVLNGRTGNANYTVSVKGTFYYNDALTVKPTASFVMTDKAKISSMQANVMQQKTAFTKEDGVANETTANGSVQVNRTYFSGLWQGQFNFDIKFKMQN